MRGQSLTLMADSAASPMPAIRRVVWRFAPDPDATLNLILTHEADLLEQVGAPDRISRIDTTAYRLMPYPSAVFGFLVSSISCRHGFFASGGARGVGVVTTRAVVESSVSILVANYVLMQALLDIDL